MMKFLFLLTTAACLQASALVYAQKITITERNSSLITIFKQIEKQSGYLFWYENELLEHADSVNIDIKGVSLNEALKTLFMNHPLTYSIINKTIVIEPIGRMVKREIRGAITDSVGVLPGVTVNVKGQKNIGTTSDINGKYLLDVPNEDVILIFTMIGYESQEIAVKGKTVINVLMKESKVGLDEVVVVAFGKQKKTEVVGSVTSIKPSDLKIPSSNLTTALAGKVAGVIAYQRSGEPGADNASFFVRGIATFGSNTSPLILIDNIELTATDLAQLQPDDIESFSIMKDAAATSLYGARGANGVILVKTKKGKEGKITTTLRLENSISAPTSNLELADPVTYMKMHNEAIITRQPFGQLLYSQEKINNTIPGSGSVMFPATDWREELIKDYAINQRANLSISGGGALVNYYISGAYTNDNGILKSDDRNNFKSGISYNTASLRSNITLKPLRTMEITTRFTGAFNDYKGPVRTGTEMYSLIMRSNPVMFPAEYPIDDEHQFTKHILFGNAFAPSGDTYYINPYAELIKGYRENGRSNLSAQLEVNQDLDFLVKGLSARALFNILRISSHSISRFYIPFWYGLGSYDRINDTYSAYNLNPDEGADYLNYSRSIGNPTANSYFEGALNYARTFNEKHQVSSMLVYQMRNNVSLGAATVQESLPYRNVGLSGRFTYGYDSRYMAEFNFGYNGSERFHSDNQFGFFPSGGIAWNISKEKWFENADFTNAIKLLKLRGTYGVVGNDNISSSRFLYLSEVNMNNTDLTQYFGTLRGYNNAGISVGRYSDPEISWEKARKANFGLEIEFNNGLSLVGDYYFENRSDILITRSNIPATMGLWVTPSSNVGEAKSYGIDASLQFDKQLTKNSWLQLMGNFTFARGQYKVYDELYYESEPWLSRVGQPINQPWGYLAERLFIDDNEVANSPQQFGVYGAGDIKYRDINNDGVITGLDRVPIGFPTTPEIIFGFGASYGYKNFDISIFFQGLAKESFAINYSQTSPFFANNDGESTGTNQLAKFITESYWNEDSRDVYAIWPRLSTSVISNNNQNNTWFMRDGSFLRVKSAELGYKLPAKLSNKVGLQQARIYLSGTNLFNWSKFDLWDVEQGGSALNYPIQRVINFGLHVTF